MQRLSDLTRQMKEQFGAAYKISDTVLAEAVLTVRLATIMGRNKLSELKDKISTSAQQMKTSGGINPIYTPNQNNQQREETIVDKALDSALAGARQGANDEAGYDTTKGLLFEGLSNGLASIAESFKKKDDDYEEVDVKTARSKELPLADEFISELQFMSDRLESIDDATIEMGVKTLGFYEDVTQAIENFDASKNDRDIESMNLMASQDGLDPSNAIIASRLEKVHEILQSMKLNDAEYQEKVIKFFDVIHQDMINQRMDELEARREASTVRGSNTAVLDNADDNKKSGGLFDFLSGLLGPESLLLLAMTRIGKILTSVFGLIRGLVRSVAGVARTIGGFLKSMAPLLGFVKAAGRVLLRFAGPIGIGLLAADAAYGAFKANDDDKPSPIKPVANEKVQAAANPRGVKSPKNKEQINQALEVASNEFGLDKDKMAGVAQRESSLRTGVSSDTGAKGLFQFTKSTWNGLAVKSENKDVLRKYAISPISGDMDQRDDPLKNAIMYGLLTKENDQKYKASTGDKEVDRYIKHFLGGPTGNKVIGAVSKDPNQTMDKLASFAYNSSKTNKALLSGEDGKPLTGQEFVATIKDKIKQDTAVAMTKLSTPEPVATSMGVLKGQQNDEKIKNVYQELAKEKEKPPIPITIAAPGNSGGNVTPIIQPGNSTAVLPSRNPSSTLQRLLDRDMATAG